jgi:hypothetical protein
VAVLRYDRRTRCAVLRAHRAYAAGQQVYDSYGAGRAPVDTLLDYGFADGGGVTSENEDADVGDADDDDEDGFEYAAEEPLDRIDLPASALGPVAAANAALLAAVGLPPEGATAALGRDGPDDGVLAWARVAAASAAELASAGWRDADAAAVATAMAARAPLSGSVRQRAYAAMGTFIGRVGATNEVAALTRLAAACAAATVAYPSALAEDEARLAAAEAAPWAPGAPAAELHALRALVSEKRALQGAAAAVAVAAAAAAAAASGKAGGKGGAASRGRRRPS